MYLTKSEIESLLNVADKRMSLIIKFLFSTGCRVSELINTRLIDCKRNGKVEINILGKGEKSRDVYISNELFNEILDVFQGRAYLFETSLHTQYKRQNLLKYIKKLGNKAALNKTVNNHIFRHSFAMYMLSLGKSIKRLSRYLGHSSVTVTIEYYLHGTLGSDITECFDF